MGVNIPAMSIAPSISEIPQDLAERRAWVIYQLRRKSLSLRDIARAEGVCHQAVSQALTGPSSHLQRAIARRIELPPQAIWPEWWSPNGTPRGKTTEPKRITRAAAGNIQSEKVA